MALPSIIDEKTELLEWANKKVSPFAIRNLSACLRNGHCCFDLYSFKKVLSII